MSFISENLGTIVVLMVLASVIAAVIFGLIRKKKKGKSSCGCACGDCPMSGSCHK